MTTAPPTKPSPPPSITLATPAASIGVDADLTPAPPQCAPNAPASLAPALAACSIDSSNHRDSDTPASNDTQGADAASGSAGDLSPSIIDMDIFTQLLEMDDEDDREFSKSIVWNYFDQAETTFTEMDAALSKQDLTELSTLGHFLKGSSAAVGVIKVRDSCEHMQHYGKCHGEDGVSDLSKDQALDKLTLTLRDVKIQYKEAAKALKAFYDEEDQPEEEQEEEPADSEKKEEAEQESDPKPAAEKSDAKA